MFIGSLSKPITITISGITGSGKAVAAAFIADKLEELGAITDFDVLRENIKPMKDAFWKDTRKFVTDNRDKVTFEEKRVHIIIDD